MSDMEPIARAMCQAMDLCKYAEKCNTGRCSVTPDAARAAYLATLKTIREPSRETANKGEIYNSRDEWPDPAEVFTAMIDHLIKEAGDEK